MSTGLITREEIKDIAKEVLSFLERNGIKDVNDLEKIVGMTSGVTEKPGHSIRVESRPSNGNTNACTLSYKISGRGIPIETRLNQKLGYTKTFVKGDFNVDGYSYFAADDFGNRAQERQSAECSISTLKEDLELLY